MPAAQSKRNVIEAVGAKTLAGVAFAGGMVLLLGGFLRATARGLLVPKVKFGRRALAVQMIRVGARSVGVIMLAQLFIGVILALQMAPPLAKYGQEATISTVIGIAGFRMLGPIITAVVMSGFAGASIAAELGTMVVSEEIEAMEAMALNPIRFLVVPRILATTVMMVLLCAIADLMIALGGYLIAWAVLGPRVYIGYWEGMRESLQYVDFYTGLIMAGVFGLLISSIACFQGLRVRGGAEGVGRATTLTVVYSMIAIILSAGLFTAIFYVFELY